MFRKKPKTTSPPNYVTPPPDAAGFPAMGTTLSAYSPNRPAQSPYAAGSQFGYAQTSYRPQGGGQPPEAPPKRASFKRRFKRFVIVLAVLLALVGGYLGVKVLINASKSFDGNIFGLLQNDKLRGEDEGRVNILLAGNSADDPGHGGATLTDSMIIISVDTVNNTAFMMSVPRDLWVDVPGNGYAKINTVYSYGEAEEFNEPGYPAGGMGALEKVIERDFGIDLHYHALINYTAFRDAVNAVGGIEVTIDSDDPRGLYDAMIAREDGGPLRLPNGRQELDGQTALNLARARGSGISYGFPQSDFNRSEHQRMMMVALKDKALSAGVLSNPIKVASLLDSFGDNVVTDFQTSEIRRLAEIGQKVPNSSIKSVSLNDADGENLLMSYQGYGGQSALAPAMGVDDYSEIVAYLETLMAPPAPADTTSGE